MILIALVAGELIVHMASCTWQRKIWQVYSIHSASYSSFAVISGEIMVRPANLDCVVDVAAGVGGIRLHETDMAECVAAARGQVGGAPVLQVLAEVEGRCARPEHREHDGACAQHALGSSHNYSYLKPIGRRKSTDPAGQQIESPCAPESLRGSYKH